MVDINVAKSNNSILRQFLGVFFITAERVLQNSQSVTQNMGGCDFTRELVEHDIVLTVHVKSVEGNLGRH